MALQLFWGGIGVEWIWCGNQSHWCKHFNINTQILNLPNASIKHQFTVMTWEGMCLRVIYDKEERYQGEPLFVDPRLSAFNRCYTHVRPPDGAGCKQGLDVTRSGLADIPQHWTRSFASVILSGGWPFISVFLSALCASLRVTGLSLSRPCSSCRFHKLLGTAVLSHVCACVTALWIPIFEVEMTTTV